MFNLKTVSNDAKATSSIIAYTSTSKTIHIYVKNDNYLPKPTF